MKVSARFLLSAHLLTYGSAVWATPIQETDSAIEECTHSSLLNLPIEVLHHVVSYTIGSGKSIDRGALALRKTRHALKVTMDDACQKILRKRFNSFLPDNDHQALPLLPATYKKKLNPHYTNIPA